MAINAQPEDILREIFKCCLDTSQPHFQPFLPQEAPLLLCGVCALWRSIALATSELWAQLSVSFGREGTDKSQPSPHLITTWIARSGWQPLSLIIRDLGLRSTSADIPNDLLMLFLPHLHRWKSITLFLPNHAFPAALTSPAPSCVASMLQTAKFQFAVDVDIHAPNAAHVAGLTRLLTSSQLHTLYWRNDLYILQHIDIHWARLTVIDLVPVWTPMYDVLQIMRQSHKLRSLSVLVTEACEVDGPVILQELVILWIGAEIDVGPLFERLSVPSLLNINVFCGNLELSIPQTAVVECIARSGCKLNTAIFKSLRIANADLITFLHRSPSLRLFEISNDGEATITDEILVLLTARDTPCLCPNLQILRFLESSVSSTDCFLADMVASRQPDSPAAIPTTPLSRLIVHFSDSDALMHTEDIRRLKCYEANHSPGFRAWVNEPETA
ncbi:hypothetical protein DFH06DRAFT_431355 [Mycena polygramma]|nr:hypothetical protein DFH06DRAFT_431355 [Mycena polygramma]